MSKNQYPESESSTVEWKEEPPQHKHIIKTVIGFCNQNGGKLVLGVKNNGEIVGLSEERNLNIGNSVFPFHCSCGVNFFAASEVSKAPLERRIDLN